MDNYICIDGVKVLLNDSQISELRAILEKKETKKSPLFERQSYGDEYYFINSIGEVGSSCDFTYDYDLTRYNNANYCTDEELLKQRALEEILARRLWRYSMEHGGDKIDWSGDRDKFTIFVLLRMVRFILVLMQFLKSLTQPILQTMKLL